MKSLLNRPSIFILIALAIVSFGCKPKVVAVNRPPDIVAPPPPPPPPPAPVPTITLTANTTAVTAGQSATLTYTATNATSVTLQPGIGAVQPTTTGTRQVTPTAATTYTATATGPGGTAQSAGVTITVNPAQAAAPPPQPPTPPTPANTNQQTAAQIFARNMVPILFDYDKSTIRPGEDDKLDRIATWLKANPNTRFTIEGHADERGGQEYNIALGDDRAAAVKKYLAGQGIADTRMGTVSYGEERPACRAQTEDCWQQNRRAAFAMNP